MRWYRRPASFCYNFSCRMLQN